MDVPNEGSDSSDRAVDAAGFLVATRVRHEANVRATTARPTPHGDEELASGSLVATPVTPEDADGRLRAASSLVASRAQHEAHERITRQALSCSHGEDHAESSCGNETSSDGRG